MMEHADSLPGEGNQLEDQYGNYGTYKRIGILRTLDERLNDMRQKRTNSLISGPYHNS